MQTMVRTAVVFANIRLVIGWSTVRPPQSHNLRAAFTTVRVKHKCFGFKSVPPFSVTQDTNLQMYADARKTEARTRRQAPATDD